MKYEIYSLFRNCNVLGLCRLLNDALLWEEAKDRSKLFDYQTVGEDELRKRYFIGRNKVDGDLFPLLGSKETGDEKNDILFYHESGERRKAGKRRVKKRGPDGVTNIYGRFYTPYTLSEVVYLKYLMRERVHHLFLSEDECRKLECAVDGYLEENNVSLSEVEALDDFLIYKGRSLLRDRWEGETLVCCKRNLKVLSEAIKERCNITYRLENASDNEPQRCYPRNIIYSQLEERLRVLVYDYHSEKYVRLYVSEMRDIEKIAKEDDLEEPPVEKTWGLVLRVYAAKNAAERLLTRLAEYEYYVIRDNNVSGTEQAFYVLVFYPEVDRLRVARRILSVGSNVEILTKKKKKPKGMVSEKEPRNQQLERFIKKYVSDADVRAAIWRNCEDMVGMIKEEVNKTLEHYV